MCVYLGVVALNYRLDCVAYIRVRIIFNGLHEAMRRIAKQKVDCTRILIPRPYFRVHKIWLIFLMHCTIVDTPW